MSERDLIEEIREKLTDIASTPFWMKDGFWPDASFPAHRDQEIYRRRQVAKDALATIARLSEALAEAEKKGAEETHALAVFLSDLSSFRYGYVSREAIDAIHHFTDSIPDERPLPAPPRDLSQGGQHG